MKKYNLYWTPYTTHCIDLMFEDIGKRATILEFVSPRVPLVEVLMLTNQGYWLIIVKVELSDRLELIKHQMKILQAKDDNDVVVKHLEVKFTQIKEPR